MGANSETEQKKQMSSIMVKDAEIESLKKKVKELREQLQENEGSAKRDSTQKVEDKAKQDLQIKEVMINQLKLENAKLQKEYETAKETITQLSTKLANIMMGGAK